MAYSFKDYVFRTIKYIKNYLIFSHVSVVKPEKKATTLIKNAIF